MIIQYSHMYVNTSVKCMYPDVVKTVSLVIFNRHFVCLALQAMLILSSKILERRSNKMLTCVK